MAGDLHCHTRISDGSLAVEDIILLAKKIGLSTIGITDHDTLAGTARAKILGKRHNIEVIQGVEFSAYDAERKQKTHIIAYNPTAPDRLERLCKKNSTSRKRAAHLMVIRACEKFPITSDLIQKCASGSTNIYKQHIMNALMETGYTNTIFGDLFQELFVLPGENNINIPVKYLDYKTVIEEIHGAGAAAVLAHCGHYNNYDLLEEELIDLGIDGVEVWHPKHAQEDVDRLLKIAKKHDLLVTGGSDFHGMYSAYSTPLGAYTTPEEDIKRLLAYEIKE